MLEKAYIFFSYAALVVSVFLIIEHYRLDGFCPYIFGIPACYIVFTAYLFVCASIFFEGVFEIFLSFFGIILALVLALYFSISQITGAVLCPVFLSIPLCFISLLVSVYLLTARIIILKK